MMTMISLSLSLWSHCNPHCCMDPVAEGHLTSQTLAVSICYLHVLPTIACCFSAWNVSPICSLLCLEWGTAFFRDLQFFAGYYWNMYGRIICFEVNLWTGEYRVVRGHLLQKQKPVPIVPSWTQATAARQCLWLEQQVALASALWRSYFQKAFRCEQVCMTCKGKGCSSKQWQPRVRESFHNFLKSLTRVVWAD